MTRRMVERHVWQDALDDVIAFTKSEQGRRIYSWRKETIERSFAEAKVNHGLRYARMLGIRNMREQSFLTAAVQNIKRLVASSFSLLLRLIARLPLLETGFVSGLRRRIASPPAQSAGCLVCRYMVTGVSEPSFHRKVILGSVPGYSLSHTALHRFLWKAMP